MEELEDTRRDIHLHFMEVTIGTEEQLLRTVLKDYQSLTVAILVSTFGLLQLVKENKKAELGIVLVLSLMHTTCLLLAITIIVSQAQ